MTCMEFRKPERSESNKFTLTALYSVLLYFITSTLISGCNPKPDEKVSSATSTSSSKTSTIASGTGSSASGTGSSASDASASASESVTHPLDPLTSNEINETCRILKQAGKITDASRFASLSLFEPAKETVLKFKTGDAIPRQSLSVIYEAASNKTFEAVVDLTGKSLLSYKQASGQALVPEDVTVVRTVVRADQDWQQAMHKRGIQNLADVYIVVWASGYLPDKAKDRHRMLKAFFYYRGPSNNAYFRPIEGVIADVDVTAKKIVKLTDTGAVPIAPLNEANIPPSLKAVRDNGTGVPDSPEAVRDNDTGVPDLKLDGHEVHWKNWRFRFAVEQRQGLVLYTVSYDDHGKIRPVLYRGSISELCVPYADPSAGWSFRDAFDVGQFGIGGSTSALEPLADAPANAKFFDAVIANQLGVPTLRPRSVALYEKDGGILWRHFDSPSKRLLSVRGKDLVLSFITTVSNYDYCFNWIFHEDGTLEMETGMTGVMLAKGVQNATAGENPHAHAVEKTIEAVHHQHFFCFRLDMDVDGAANNSFVETNGVSMPGKSQNPHGNAFCMTETRLRHEKDAVRLMNLSTTRRWKVINDSQKNALGQNTGYMLLPGENSIPYALQSSFVRQRAGFINAHVWATAYDPTQMYAAGDYPFDGDGSKGLSDWVKANRSLEKADIVLWYNMGITHTPRPEEWPIMPVHKCGFKLTPNCFFEKNPVLDFQSAKPEVTTH